jgi:hypothetical protein
VVTTDLRDKVSAIRAGARAAADGGLQNMIKQQVAPIRITK